MSVRHWRRRHLLLGSLLLQACTTPLARMSRSTATEDARALLAASAAAHGGAALSEVGDLSVSYAGTWHGLVERLQPALVDAGFRGGSQERLLLRDLVVAQAHTGPSGHKQVVRRSVAGSQGEVRVWFNGAEARDGERRAAAALVADGYSLFLLGPMLLAGRDGLVMEVAAPERIVLDDGAHECDVLRMRMVPGIGFSASDDVALYIDRDVRLMRRVRFTVNGMDSTRGAIAEVDTWEHRLISGVTWPTRFRERLLRPFPLPVHEWRLTGLDLSRGLAPSDIEGNSFQGPALSDAATLPNE